MSTSKKARGQYDKFSKENQKLYDEMMQKSFISELEKFTKKELAYLTDLYERKVKEVKLLHKEQLEEKDVATIVLSIKLKAAVVKKEINLTQYRYNKKYQLTTAQKQEARNKVNRLCKA